MPKFLSCSLTPPLSHCELEQDDDIRDQETADGEGIGQTQIERVPRSYGDDCGLAESAEEDLKAIAGGHREGGAVTHQETLTEKFYF